LLDRGQDICDHLGLSYKVERIKSMSFSQYQSITQNWICKSTDGIAILCNLSSLVCRKATK
jgi:hypothetical protein